MCREATQREVIAMIIAFCKEKGIKYCFAPFEADWQLVSLQKQGIIQQFYVIGTALATTVPVMGWTPLKSLEQLGPFVVFMGIQLIEYCERVRVKKQLSFAKAWLLRLHRFCWDCVLRTWLNV